VSAWRRVAPTTITQRVRGVLLLVALVIGISLVPDLVLSLRTEAARGLGGLVAIGVLAWRWQNGYRRGGYSVAGDIVGTGALIVALLATDGAAGQSGLLFAGLSLQALHGSSRRVALTVALFSGADLVAWALGAAPIDPVVGLALTGVLMHIVATGLGRHDQLAHRLRLLTASGTALAAATGQSEIAAVAIRAAAEVVDRFAGARVSIALASSRQVRIVAAAGECADELNGLAVPIDRLPAHLRSIIRAPHVHLDHRSVARIRDVTGLPAHPGGLDFLPLRAGRRLHGWIAVESPGPLPSDARDVLVDLANQVSLALVAEVARSDAVRRRDHPRFRALTVSPIIRDTTESTRPRREPAHHDTLTGLASRDLFIERLEAALDPRSDAGGSRRSGHVAFLLVNIDNLGLVNDSLGHSAGDELLAIFADRLRTYLRMTDTAARFLGGQFTILLDGIEESAEATLAADGIRRLAREPFWLAGREVVITASIGLAVATRGADRPEDLLHDANLALQRAKRRGRGHRELFSPPMTSPAPRRLELEGDLRRAMRDGALHVEYQPIVNLQTGQVHEYEALVRWQHPRHGLISPAEFIPLAEEAGLIDALGQLVLVTACGQLRSWQVSHPQGAPIGMAVNLSPRQLHQRDLADAVAAMVAASGIEPGRLTLEITESVILEDDEGVPETIHRLHALGIRLVIDDFGTGYSSLAYLRRLPVDGIKIDRSLIVGIGQGRKDTAIVTAAIEFARALGVTVTGEGIETPEQLEALRRLGCDFGQGYHLGRPAVALVPGTGAGWRVDPVAPALVRRTRGRIATVTGTTGPRIH
jgi:diguanylate cyclase (GGDEF)-like protein